MRSLFALILMIIPFLIACHSESENVTSLVMVEEDVFVGLDSNDIPEGAEGELIRYGLELIRNTANYIGPDGINGNYLGNKMNCTNCHVDAGTRPYGFNFYSTYGNYPQYRSRENAVLSIEQRVNNCVERPHNGIPLPLDSKEMTAIVSYIKFLGTNVSKGETKKGSGGIGIDFIDRPADPVRGKQIYLKECARCHMENGEGKWLPNEIGYEYPPLWGPKAYQQGSSMFRVIKAARFIKANMPQDKATWDKPYLSDEEAFDVAAYINSPEHNRPTKSGEDYENIGTKYVDYPFGPYNDPFSEEQHKYGPFEEIIEYRKKNKLYLKY